MDANETYGDKVARERDERAEAEKAAYEDDAELCGGGDTGCGEAPCVCRPVDPWTREVVIDAAGDELDTATIRRIRQLYVKGYTPSEIAAHVGTARYDVRESLRSAGFVVR